MTSVELWLRLVCARGLPPAAMRAAVAALNDAVARVGISDAMGAVSASLREVLQASDINAELEWRASGDQRHIIDVTDERYPPLLAEIPDPPPVLFVHGNLDALSLPAIAVVGSRRATAVGLGHALDFARTLAEAGVVVVSGLALGIDAAAHRAALIAGGQTVAVMATGIDRVYPRRNQSLAAAIVAGGGALVSESPLGTTPQRHRFPLRNRIISGLSLSTLVVEASSRSGSLITARLAAEQGRDVFAIPGSIRSPSKRGCHALIRDGAQLTESPCDLLMAMGRYSESSDAGAAHNSPANLSGDEQTLLEVMDFEPQVLDELAAHTGWSAARVAAAALELEIRGIVMSEPGTGFQRLR